MGKNILVLMNLVSDYGCDIVITVNRYLVC